MSNAITTTSAVKTANSRRKSWRNFSEEEKAEYRKAKHERQKALADFIGKLTPEDREKILKACKAVVTIEEHPLSPCNTVLCWYQRGGVIDANGVKRVDLSVVGGVQQWRKAGRRIKKGEKGLAIWIPCTKKEGSNKGEAETALAIPSQIVDENGETKTRTYFRVAMVFDISQTVPLAEPDEMPRQIECGEVIDVEAVAV